MIMKMLVSIILFSKAISCDLVPSQSFRVCKFRNNIIGAPILIINWCDGSPRGFKRLKILVDSVQCHQN